MCANTDICTIGSSSLRSGERGVMQSYLLPYLAAAPGFWVWGGSAPPKKSGGLNSESGGGGLTSQNLISKGKIIKNWGGLGPILGGLSPPSPPLGAATSSFAIVLFINEPRQKSTSHHASKVVPDAWNELSRWTRTKFNGKVCSHRCIRFHWRR